MCASVCAACVCASVCAACENSVYSMYLCVCVHIMDARVGQLQ